MVCTFSFKLQIRARLLVFILIHLSSACPFIASCFNVTFCPSFISLEQLLSIKNAGLPKMPTFFVLSWDFNLVHRLSSRCKWRKQAPNCHKEKQKFKHEGPAVWELQVIPIVWLRSWTYFLLHFFSFPPLLFSFKLSPHGPRMFANSL